MRGTRFQLFTRKAQTFGPEDLGTTGPGGPGSGELLLHDLRVQERKREFVLVLNFSHPKTFERVLQRLPGSEELLGPVQKGSAPPCPPPPSNALPRDSWQPAQENPFSEDLAGMFACGSLSKLGGA